MIYSTATYNTGLKRGRRRSAHVPTTTTTVTLSARRREKCSFIHIPAPLLFGLTITSAATMSVLFVPSLRSSSRRFLRRQVLIRRVSLMLFNKQSQIEADLKPLQIQQKQRFNEASKSILYQVNRFRQLYISKMFLKSVLSRLILLCTNLINVMKMKKNNKKSKSAITNDLLLDNQSSFLLSSANSSSGDPLSNVQVSLDRMRDRAVAQLENERLASSSSLSNTMTSNPISTTANTNNNTNSTNSTNKSSNSGDSEIYISDKEYALLPSLQRRELLASTFDHRLASEKRRSDVMLENQRQRQKHRQRQVITLQQEPTQNKSKQQATLFQQFWKNNSKSDNNNKYNGNKKRNIQKNQLSTQLTFWQVVESINGRAAAIGFMLCLAREVAEPGHPSLFEQVVDVVVPIAQSTPPFVVAVCDRLADLLT